MVFTGEQKIQGIAVCRVLSFLSLGLVFTVIIFGAYLSARGQGLSCSDWPLCPTGFNLSPDGEYFIEYLHRIIALIAALSSAMTVSIQMAIGMLVVFSELHPIIVAIHTGVGVFTLALALLTFILSYPVFTRHPLSKASSEVN